MGRDGWYNTAVARWRMESLRDGVKGATTMTRLSEFSIPTYFKTRQYRNTSIQYLKRQVIVHLHGFVAGGGEVHIAGGGWWSGGGSSLHPLEAPGIQVGEIFTLPFAATQVKMHLDGLAFFVRIEECAAVLRELEFDELRVITILDFDDKFACLKGLCFALGVIFFQ